MFRTALIAIAAVCVGGCGHASNSDGRALHPPAVKLQAQGAPVVARHSGLADQVFAFGDRFEAVGYQMSFTPAARDADATARACGAFVRSRGELAIAFTSLRGAARELAGEIMGTAASAVEACNQPAGEFDETLAENVQLDFAAFREIAFDFAHLSSNAA